MGGGAPTDLLTAFEIVASVGCVEDGVLRTPQRPSPPRTPPGGSVEDEVLRTPSPVAAPTLEVDGSPSSLTGRVKRFAQRVIKKAASPLLRTRVYDSSSKMPIRSTRIAAQQLANIPVAKRGEALVIQRLARSRGTTLEAARADYGSMFEDDPPDANSEALRELFPDGARPRHSRRAGRAVAPEPSGDDVNG
jgi:hypothetical protein